jgi:cell wall-associated NlpC family hydrolase
LPALVLGALTAALLTAPAAGAATAPPKGGISSAVQNTFTHALVVRGWAYDPARPATSIVVEFYANGVFIGRTTADHDSPVLVSKYRIPGRHAFSFAVSRGTVPTIVARSGGVTNGARTTLATKPVSHYWPSPGDRIVTVAKRYVGTTRYVDGGSTPSTGFDCSGYTAWVYSHALVKTLPHNAEAQRRGMRLISAAAARPGDLVFYLSGGTAYHVAIYAGHHMQYAAATARDGIRYQAVWSSAVQYRTDWH